MKRKLDVVETAHVLTDVLEANRPTWLETTIVAPTVLEIGLTWSK